MGTRSLTVVKDERDKTLVVMYRQFDGYYEGHGTELADFLSGFKIVNGMRGDEPPKFANGMGCLAAQIVTHFKNEPGGIYLYPAETENVGEKYVYIVRGKTGEEPEIIVDEFSGKASDFHAFMEKQRELDEE